VLHFRIFDGDGKLVVDTDEKRVTERVRSMENLRNQLNSSRSLDGDGKLVVDTDENWLTERVRSIEDLRNQLNSLWSPHELTRSEKGRVITAVASIVGHTLDADGRRERPEPLAVEEGIVTGVAFGPDNRVAAAYVYWDKVDNVRVYEDHGPGGIA